MSDSLFSRFANILTNGSACATVGGLSYGFDTYSEHVKHALYQMPYANETVDFLVRNPLLARTAMSYTYNLLKNDTSFLASVVDTSMRIYALPMIVRAGAEIISNTTGLSPNMINIPAQIATQVLYTKAKNTVDFYLTLYLKDEDGNTGLHRAAKNYELNTLNALIQAGANLDLQNQDGETALMLAALHGHTAIVNALIQAGADIMLMNNSGNTALTLAAQREHDEMTFFILSTMSFQQVSTALQNNPELKVQSIGLEKKKIKTRLTMLL